MGKAQAWILVLLLGAVVIQVAASADALAAAKNKHPVQAVQTVNPKLILYVLIGFALLELLSEVAPEFAVGIAALLFAGAALMKGPQALSGLKGGSGG